MSNHLVTASCGLVGQTFVICGTITNGYAILYTINKTSNAAINFIQMLPNILENTKHRMVVIPNQDQNADPNRNPAAAKFWSFARKPIILIVSTVTGLGAKIIGNYLLSPAGIERISNALGVRQSPQNLIPASCELMGQTLFISGTILNSYATLYVISRVSATAMKCIHLLPDFIEDPKYTMMKLNADANANANENENTNNGAQAYPQNNVRQLFASVVTKAGVLCVLAGIGLGIKSVGYYLLSSEGMERISKWFAIK